MAIGSGLASQVGIGAESTVGTAVTVDHFLEFDSESVNFTKNTLQGVGLHAGGLYNRANRRVISTVTAGGDLTVEAAYNKQLLLWKNILGTLVGPTSISTGVYSSVITPGSLKGTSLTYQKGVPQTDGTVQPFTFNGCKVTGAKFSVSTSQIAMLACTVDAWNVATATSLAAASYSTTNGVFNFSQATIKIGGTPSTTSGVTSISGGTPLTTLVNAYELDFSNPMKVDRYGLGSAGVKKEQIENDYRPLTGTLTGEFTQRSEIWDLFQADTGTSLQITFTGPNITSGNPYKLDIVLPSVKFDTGELSVAGPDVVPLNVNYTVLDNQIDNVCQVTIVNADASV